MNRIEEYLVSNPTTKKRSLTGVDLNGVDDYLKEVASNVASSSDYDPRITSGFRTQQEQDALQVPGKARVSLHSSGRAVDQGIKELKQDQIDKTLEAYNSYPGINASVHNRNHIHIEDRLPDAPQGSGNRVGDYLSTTAPKKESLFDKAKGFFNQQPQAPEETNRVADYLKASSPQQPSLADKLTPISQKGIDLERGIRTKGADLLESVPGKINESLGLNKDYGSGPLNFARNASKGLVEAGVGFPLRMQAGLMRLPEEISQQAIPHPVEYTKNVAKETGKQLIAPFDPREYTADKLYNDPVGRIVNAAMAFGIAKGGVDLGKGLMSPKEAIPDASLAREPVVESPKQEAIPMPPKGGSLEGLVKLLPEKAGPSNELLPSEKVQGLIGKRQTTGVEIPQAIRDYLEQIKEKETFTPQIIKESAKLVGDAPKASYEGPTPIIGKPEILPELPGDRAPAITNPEPEARLLPRPFNVKEVPALAQAEEVLPKGQKEGSPQAGKIKTRGLSKGVESKAIANKLTENLGDLPEYKTVNMKEQAQKASDLLSQDPERAHRIAMGHEDPPRGILPESLFVAVEDRAIKAGDVETIRRLANSGLTGQATTMGQRIRTLAERNPESPVAAIQELSRAREDAFKRRSLKDVEKAKATTVKEIDSAVKKAAPTKETWSSFMNSIRC